MKSSISGARKMKFRAGIIVLLASFALFIAPFSASAAEPFGGRAAMVKKCNNNTIYSILGPPRGGAYIWTKTTRTYKFGPPKVAGQWLLGLKSIPFLCLYSKSPIITLPGRGILILGTSLPPPAPSSGLKLPSIDPSIGAAAKVLGL